MKFPEILDIHSLLVQWYKETYYNNTYDFLLKKIATLFKFTQTRNNSNEYSNNQCFVLFMIHSHSLLLMYWCLVLISRAHTKCYRIKSRTNIVDCRSKSSSVSFDPRHRETFANISEHLRPYVRSFTNGNGKWRTADLCFYIPNFMKWTQPWQSYHVLFVALFANNE